MQRPDAPAFRAFFGDRERDFRLAPELITELERVTGAGIGGFSRRFFGGDFKHADLMAVIRLALIGGGETPQRAAELLDAYAIRRPVMEVFPLAVGALEVLMFGEPKPEEATDDATFREAAE
jgi:hypothetical protein